MNEFAFAFINSVRFRHQSNTVSIALQRLDDGQQFSVANTDYLLVAVGTYKFSTDISHKTKMECVKPVDTHAIPLPDCSWSAALHVCQPLTHLAFNMRTSLYLTKRSEVRA